MLGGLFVSSRLDLMKKMKNVWDHFKQVKVLSYAYHNWLINASQQKVANLHVQSTEWRTHKVTFHVSILMKLNQ